MTIPFTPDESNPLPSFGSMDGIVAGAAFSALNARTEGNVKSMLQDQIASDTTWSALWDVFFGFIKAPFEWVWAALTRLFPFIDWQTLEGFDFWESAAWVIDQLKQVPFVGDVATWLGGAADGTFATVSQWFENVREFLAHINFFAEDFDLLAATEDFIEFVLFPVGKLADAAGLGEIAETIYAIGGAITGFLGDSLAGTVATLTTWFGNVREFFAGINFLDGSFDLLAAAEDFIDFVLLPVRRIVDFGWLLDIFQKLFPGLDWNSIGSLPSFDDVLAWFENAIGEIPFLSDVSAAIQAAIQGLWDSIFGIFRKLFPDLPWDSILSGSVSDIVDWLIDSVNSIPQAITDAVTGAWASIFGIFQKLFPGLPWDSVLSGSVSEIIDWLVDSLNGIPFVADVILLIQDALNGLWNNIFGILRRLFPFLPWDALLSGSVDDVIGWLLGNLTEVPFVGDIVLWTTGALGGTWETLQVWFGNLRTFLGAINFFDPDFDLLAAGEAFIDFVLFPVGKIAEMGQGLLDWINDTLLKPVIGVLTGNGLNLDLGALGVWARSLLGQGSRIPAENLFGQVSSSLFGIIPVSHISNEQPNLLTQGNFDVASTVEDSGGWSWDSDVTYTGTGGSVRAVADGAIRLLYCNQDIKVSPGDKVALTAYYKTSANFSGGSQSAFLTLVPFAGAVQQAGVTIGVGGPSPSWSQLYGNVYTVPAGVTSLRVRLALSSSAAAGTVWFDDVRLAKTGLLQQGLVERLVDAWSNFWNGVFGGVETGKTVDDILVAGAALANTANTASGNALQALDGLADLVWKLLNAPAQILGSIGSVIMDGVSSIGQFLTGLWNSLTGQSDSSATVADVATAASALSSTANSATATADSAAAGLQTTWDDMFDAFNGTTGSTGKTSANARDRGAVVRSTALSAQAAANTATENAAVADSKARVAQDTIDGLATSANMVISPNFEDSSIGRLILSSGQTQSYTTETSYQGTQCYKLTSVTGPYKGFYLAPTETLKRYYCKPGDTFSASIMIKSAAGNPPAPAAGAWRLYINFIDSKTGQATRTAPELAFTQLTGDWQELSGTATCPSDRDCLEVHTMTTGAWDGASFYFDSAVVREETTARVALDGAGAAQATANTAEANADAAAAVAALAQSTADAGRFLARANIAAGANLATDGNFDNTNIAVAGANAARSSEMSFNGTHSVRITQPGNYYGFIFPVTDEAGNTGYTIPAVEGDRFYVECMVYGDPANADYAASLWWQSTILRTTGGNTNGATGYVSSNSTKGVWTKQSGYMVMPANTFAVQFYWVSNNNLPAGNRYFVDSVKIYRVTEAYNAQVDADAAEAEAQNAIANAEAADSKAVVAQGVANASVSAGANLCPNPGWESTAFALVGNSSNVMSTEQKRSGTRSLKLTGTGVNTQYTYVITDTTSYVNVPCKAGDVFYVSAWVYGKSTNVQTSGGANGIAIASDPTTVSGSPYISPQYVYATASTALNGVWTEISGYITMPANTQQASFYVALRPPCASGEVYYVDDIKIYRVTEAQAAQLVADTAQKSVNLIALSGDNKVVSPTFEDSTVARFKYTTLSAQVYDTSEKYAGTQSLKMTVNSPGWNGFYLAPLDAFATAVPYRMDCKPGDVISSSIWFKPSVSNTYPTNGYCRLFLRFWQSRAGGSYTDQITSGTYVLYSGSMTPGGWHKLDVTGICPQDRTAFDVFVLVNGDNPAGSVFWFDNAEVRDITKAYYAQLDADAAQDRADDAFVNAGTARGDAEIAQSVGYSAGLRGASILPNGDFENGNFYVGTSASRYLDTSEKHSGTQSLRTKGYTWTPLFANKTSFMLKSPCRPGDVLYCEAWIRGHTSNVATGSREAYIQVQFFKADGTVFTTPAQLIKVNAGTGLNGVWTKLSGHITAPADAYFHDFTLVTYVPEYPNNVYWWDDAKLYRVTEGQEAKALSRAASGYNMVIDGGFENSNVWSTLGADWSLSTTVKRNGLSSMKVVCPAGTSSLGLHAGPDGVFSFWNTMQGKKYLIEAWVYAPTSNSNAAGLVQIWSAVRTASNTWVYNPGGTPGIYAASMTKGVWTKISAVVNFNDVDAVYWYPYLRMDATCVDGDVFYWDDIVVTEWTGTQDVIDSVVQGGSGVTSTGNSITLLKDTVFNVQATAALGVSDASDADDKATKAAIVADAALYAGANLIRNSSFEDATFFLSGVGCAYSIEQANTGVRSVKLSGSGSPWFYLFNNLTDLYRQACKPSDVFRFSFWVYGHASNNEAQSLRFGIKCLNKAGVNVGYGYTDTAVNSTYNSKWSKISGTVTLPATSTISQFMPYVQRLIGGDDIFYIDDVELEQITEAAAAKDTAKTADDKAVVAQNALASTISSGANICANPSFENTDFKLANTSKTSYSTAMRRTGSRSVQMVGLSGANIDVSFFSSTSSGLIRLPVQEGDTFAFEAWIRGGSGNTKVAGVIRPYLYSGDPAAPTVSYPANIAYYAGNLTDLNAGWQKLSGTFVVPAGGVALEVVVQLHTSAGTGCILHVDDIACYRITEAAAAQATIDLKARDFSNLAAGSDFEGAASPWVAVDGEGFTLDTTEKHSGTQSLLLAEGSGGRSAHLGKYLTVFEAKPGEQYYVETWARRTRSFSSIIDGKLRVGDQNNALVDELSLRTGQDDAEGYVTSLLRFGGNDGSTVIDDSSMAGVQWDAYGDATIQTAVSKFGGSALAVDGVGDYIKAASGSQFAFGTDNFTIEFWARLNSTTTTATFYDSRASNASNPLIYITAGGVLRYFSNSGIRITGPTLAVNTWYHIAVSRVANVTRLFVNGTQHGISYTDNGNFLSSAPVLGNSYDLLYPLNGYLDEVRITQGVGRYSANFTAPAASFPELGVFAGYDQWEKLSKTFTVPSGVTGLNFSFQFNTTVGSLWLDDVVIRKVVPADAIPTIPPSKVDGLPTDVRVDTTLLNHGKDIQELQAALDTAVNQGRSFSVDFSAYPNGNIPSNFVVNYLGTTGNSVGVSNGQAGWVTSNAVNSDATIIYVGDDGDGRTLTDSQKIRGVLYNPPTPPKSGFSQGPRFWALGRVSDDGNSYVWARAFFKTGLQLVAEMGCVIDGVEYVWKTNIPLNWSLTMTFICGTDDDDRGFQIWSGGSLVTSHTDTALDVNNVVIPYSYMGAGYRRYGARTEVRVQNSSVLTGGTVSSVAVSDNKTPLYAGSLARMVRLSPNAASGLTTTTAGVALSTLFDDVAYESLDIDGNVTDGTFTVSKSKMYLVTARVKLNSYTDANTFLHLQKLSGTWATVQRGPSMWGADSGFNAINPNSGFVLAATWIQYLEAGDKIRLFVQQDRTGHASGMVGSSDGSETYFAISGLQ